MIRRAAGPAGWRRRAAGAAAIAAAAGAAIAGCGEETVTVVLSPPPVSTVTDTPTPAPPPGSLSLSISGQPTRSFIVFGGRWKVCDTGSVVNEGRVTAHDVRVVATYVDKGVIVGETTRDEAAADGGALGDIAPGGVAKFTFCAIARNEPDVDRLSASAAG